MVLFSGGGGSSWGARAAGIEIVAAIDLWKLAGETHKANFPETEFIESRLEDLDLPALVTKIGKIDLIIASPECTSHSPAKGNKPRSEQSKDTAFQVVRLGAWVSQHFQALDVEIGTTIAIAIMTPLVPRGF